MAKITIEKKHLQAIRNKIFELGLSIGPTLRGVGLDPMDFDQWARGCAKPTSAEYYNIVELEGQLWNRKVAQK